MSTDQDFSIDLEWLMEMRRGRNGVFSPLGIIDFWLNFVMVKWNFLHDNISFIELPDN